MAPRPDPLASIDLVEAFHLCHATATLHELGLLASAKRPATAEALARKHGVQAAVLRGVLEFVAERTDLLRRRGKRFVATSRYDAASRFLLDLYAGAYRRNAAELAALLAKPSLAVKAVDRARHARAFESAGASPGLLAGLVRQLRLKRVVDLGCGPGSLLLHLAAADGNFFGWGVDANPAMCRGARTRIRRARLGRRVKVILGDARRPTALLPSDIRAQVDAVTASQLANELFKPGDPAAAVAWLRSVRAAFPGRLLFLADYYGRLGTPASSRHRETVLHDYAQLISGQGVPPASLAQWRRIYGRAGCKLLHVMEDRKTSLFIHVLSL